MPLASIGGCSGRDALSGSGKGRDSRAFGFDAAASFQWNEEQFPTNQGKRCPRAVSMEVKRTARRRMVDRGKQWHVQDGNGKNPESKCHFHCLRPRLGRYLQRSAQWLVGIPHRPVKGSRRPENGQTTRRNFPLEVRFSRNSHIRRWVGFLRLMRAEEIEISLDRGACTGADFEGFKA